MAALTVTWEQQRKAEEEQCRALLHEVRWGDALFQLLGSVTPLPAAGLAPAQFPRSHLPLPNLYVAIQVVHKLPEARREELDIHRHVLPAAGGASGGLAGLLVCT